MKNPPVLVVDDSACTANIVVALLKLCGFPDVDQELSAQSALWKLAQRPYGLIIADAYMPGMGGVDLLAAVRGGPFRSDTCFLLMTAMRDRQTIQAAVNNGADGILLKPFTVDNLKIKLASLAKLKAA